jgi:hypothetical protein
MAFNEVPIKGLSLDAFVSLYDSPIYANYGIEFLTAGKTGMIAPGKYIDMPPGYSLPAGIAESFLEEKIEEVVRHRIQDSSSSYFSQRVKVLVRETRKRWENGQYPKVIRGIDALRKDLDFISTEQYDGTRASSNNITYGLKSLPFFAYLFAAALFGSSASEESVQIFPSSRLGYDALRYKLGNACTAKESRSVLLKMPYCHVLSLLGLPMGKKKNISNLGLDFIGELCSFESKHALHALKRFMEGILDYRMSAKKGSGAYINLPYLSDADINDKLSALFGRVSSIVFPSLEFKMIRQKKESIYRTIYYVKKVDSLKMIS